MDPIGRGPEIECVVRRLRERRPVAVVGEAGVGKTTVLRAAVASSGMPAHVTGCLATLAWSSLVPFTPLLGPPGPTTTVESVGRQLLRLVGDGVLVLDDLQWADHETRELLPILAGRIALAVAVRTPDSGAEKALAEMAAIDADLVAVQPLPAADARRLVELARPDLSNLAAHEVTERGAGNPLLLEALCHGDHRADTLRMAYAARFAELSRPAAGALARLALLGRPVDLATLGPGADELVDAGLAVWHGDRVAIRHPVIAEVAMLEIGADEARRVHRELAASVASRGEEAHHLAAAGDRDQAHDAAREASAEAAPAERARLLALAARNAPSDVADVERLEAAEALLRTGQRLTADALAAEITARVPRLRARGGLVRCRAQWAVGDDLALASEIDAGLDLTRGSATPEEVGFRVWEARRSVRFSTDHLTTRQLADRALDLGEEVGAHRAAANAVVGSALLQVAAPECRSYFEAAVRIGVADGDFETVFDAGNSLLGSYQVMGDWDGYGRVADELLEIAETADLEHWVLLGAAVRALPAIHARGEYARTVEALRELIRQPLVARGRITAGAHLVLALGVLGRHDEAAQVLERDVPTFERDVFEGLWRYWAGAESRWLAADPAAALAYADDGLAASLGGAPQRPLLGLMRAWALFDLGRDPGAAPDPSFFPLLGPVAVEYAGIRALADDRPSEAAEHFELAAAAWQSTMRHAALRCSWANAEARRQAGDQDGATDRALAVEADALAVGAEPFVLRTHRTLRLLGHQRAAPRSPSAPLTGQERRVLALVAEGLTSDEIGRRLGLGGKSVDGAIESAMTRLGATTRLQAALLAGESGT